jgi:hypothetical protein
MEDSHPKKRVREAITSGCVLHFFLNHADPSLKPKERRMIKHAKCLTIIFLW